ncbi:RNA polymerase sigma factor RpoE [Lachnospiraceae bacterium TWA4]|nr:RNA polymerase sigma factor RpoE [Lachnospiraceae bacterium TWA4]
MNELDEIYQSHAKTVFKYLMTLVRNEDLAEELTQETFYQAVKSINRYDESCKISTWLCSIAKNQYLNYLKTKRQISLEEVDESEFVTKSSEENYIASIDRIRLLKKLHTCPEPYREVMYLRIFGNLSFKEVGDIMGKSENWARVTFYRGKQKLKMEVEAHEE